MYLRVAPELYLKRLVVGGFERVYEINRNFRNEGLSTQHNPEFTMLELYWAYGDFRDLMDWVEKAFRGLAEAIHGGYRIEYQGRAYDLARPFRRVTVEECLLEHNPDLDPMSLREEHYLHRVCDSLQIPYKQGDGAGKLQIEIFGKTVEHQLLDPTFVYAYPSGGLAALARQRPGCLRHRPVRALTWPGARLANGFSELNDPEEQAARFRDQAARKSAGDEEAMYYDADYVRALEYGDAAHSGARRRR